MGLADILERIALELRSKKSSEIFTEDYWIRLRKNTSVEGEAGGYCVEWCEQAYRIIDNDGFGSLFIFQGTCTHSWLEHKSWRVGKFIADGTAGQFDLNYPEGFYGMIESASEELQKIYDGGFRRH